MDNKPSFSNRKITKISNETGEIVEYIDPYTIDAMFAIGMHEILEKDREKKYMKNLIEIFEDLYNSINGAKSTIQSISVFNPLFYGMTRIKYKISSDKFNNLSKYRLIMVLVHPDDTTFTIHLNVSSSIRNISIEKDNKLLVTYNYATKHNNMDTLDNIMKENLLKIMKVAQLIIHNHFTNIVFESVYYRKIMDCLSAINDNMSSIQDLKRRIIKTKKNVYDFNNLSLDIIKYKDYTYNIVALGECKEGRHTLFITKEYGKYTSFKIIIKNEVVLNLSKDNALELSQENGKNVYLFLSSVNRFFNEIVDNMNTVENAIDILRESLPYYISNNDDKKYIKDRINKMIKAVQKDLN